MKNKINDLQWYDGDEFDEEIELPNFSSKRRRSSIFDDPLEVFIEFLSEEELIFIEVDPTGRRILITIDEETGLELRELIPDDLI
ncbi:hypothetical protein [uncultured Roseobacter sp.]|uniref:hypothetical protein n=1 Tax=uncultured Roseobacter sp. TaxID=114847 RepID=UPI0026396066|nr:hypothetical protein [uncultured Roseobacter sp.]